MESLPKFGTLFKDENQYVTWALVLLGWAIAALVAYIQYSSGAKDSEKEYHNEWIGEFRTKLENLEDFALEFWAEQSLKNPTLAIAKMSREIKSLTTTAKDIQKAGGVSYQPKLFKDLRQAMTFDADIANRPLAPDCMQIRRIRETCTSLRMLYGRKN